MAEQLISELEKAAQIILAPPNLITNEQRRTAEEVFLNFRKTESPYQLCRQILETNTNDYILFEATGLIKIALIKEWTTLPKEDVSSFGQYLLHYVINKPYLAQYVKACILQVIAIMIKRGSVNDSGQERQQILGEVENLIMIGDLPRKILGCNLISAMLQEYAIATKSSDIGLTWEVHLKERHAFEVTDLKRIFKFCVIIFDELIMKQDMQEDTITLLKHLLPIVESILTWTPLYSHSSVSFLVTCFQESQHHQSLNLSEDWEDVILLPSILDLFFTLYWKIRGNPQLAHHARTCLVQLASLNGRIISSEKIKLQYLLNYMQRFLKFVTSIDIIDQEASGIATIIRKLIRFFLRSFTSLPKDLFNSFMNQVSHLTCLFIENTVREESLCPDECLYMEALDIMFDAWIHILSEKVLFSLEFCNQSSIRIFDMYLKCHLITPEGIRNVAEKELDKEDIGFEEDDKIRFKEQLQVIGKFGRQILNHSLPLLAQLIEDRTSKLRENLNKLAGQVESLNTINNSMSSLYEDIHWLLLITGHVLCMESDGEVAIMPFQIMKYSMEQTRQGKVDINLTLQLLASSENISSDMNVTTESVDHVIRLVADVFRLCAIEKTAVSVHLDSILSPELSCTIVWFLHRWSLNYLLLAEDDYDEISITFIQAFGEDTPGAVWATNFLLGKIEYNINAFKSEPILMEETIKLLLSLVHPQEKAICTFKSERFRSIMNLSMKGQYDMPQTVKRGLMRALCQIGIAVQDIEQNYWSQTLQLLQDRCKQIISNEKFTQSYHQEEIKIQIIDILECFIGIAQGVQNSKSSSLFQYVYSVLQELPNLLCLYHNYQQITQLILELLCECAEKPILCYLGKIEPTQIHEICLNTIQNYARYNTNRLTVDSTAEENSYQDILLLIKLLTNISLTSVIPADIFLCGLNTIISVITMDLLKFPSLCWGYFEMIEQFCQVYPRKVYTLNPELLQPLLGSVELGLYSFGYKVSILCCNIIESLARHIYFDVAFGRPRNQLMAPFLNSLMTITLSHQIDDFITSIGLSIYYLICCYQEEYQQLVQNILSSQSDQQVAQRLTDAFTKLTHGIEFDTNREDMESFKNHFNEFVINVQGFLMVK